MDTSITAPNAGSRTPCPADHDPQVPDLDLGRWGRVGRSGAEPEAGVSGRDSGARNGLTVARPREGHHVPEQVRRVVHDAVRIGGCSECRRIALERFRARRAAVSVVGPGRLADGESLRAICRGNGMPDRSAVLHWIAGSAELQCTYALAVEARADELFDEVLETADDARGDWAVKDGKPVLDAENVRRAMLRIDARKWALARMAHKRYGGNST